MLSNLVLEMTLESPLDRKEIKPVNPKGNQSWIFIGRTDAEAPILWPPDVKNWLTGKDPDAGKNWRQEGKGTTEDEMVGRHHWLNRHEFEQAPGVDDGQGSLVCCSPWGFKSQTWLSDWTELIIYLNRMKKKIHSLGRYTQKKEGSECPLWPTRWVKNLHMWYFLLWLYMVRPIHSSDLKNQLREI